MRTSVTITNLPIIDAFIEHGRFEHAINVLVKGENEFKKLRTFFPNEMNFEISELIGLTTCDARKLLRQKDMIYLQTT